VVTAAVIITWIAATGTAVITVLFTAAMLWLGAPMFETFDPGLDNPRTYLLGFAVLVVALSILADALAYLVSRRSHWARWLLVALCVPVALAGIISWYYVAPLLVTAAALAVVVLLLLPAAHSWFHATP
jgi:hypothetical protein